MSSNRFKHFSAAPNNEKNNGKRLMNVGAVGGVLLFCALVKFATPPEKSSASYPLNDAQTIPLREQAIAFQGVSNLAALVLFLGGMLYLIASGCSQPKAEIEETKQFRV